MGYGGKTVNGLSSLGPKIGKISQSQDDVLSGKETKMENDSMGSAKMISGGHSKGKFMSTPKYKGPRKESQDHKMAYDRSEISRLKKDIHFDDTKKKVKSVNEIGDRTRKDTYSYQKPKAEVLKQNK